LDIEHFSRVRPLAYHATAAQNFTNIRRERVLYSAAALAPGQLSQQRLAEHPVIKDNELIVLRDQRALRPGHAELTGGWTWEDLLAALNSRVFFWPGTQDSPNSCGRNFADAYRERGEHLLHLRVPLIELLMANPDQTAYFCRYNSGAPRMSGGRRSPRGPHIFKPAAAWAGPASNVAEISFVGAVVLPDSTSVWDDVSGWRPL
jgi:hypothetical protein